MNKKLQSGKFENIPVDPDTNIISRQILILDGIDALHETWSWDGYSGESIVFIDSDIESIQVDDLKKKIIHQFSFDENIPFTIKRNVSGFIFFNFNFSDQFGAFPELS